MRLERVAARLASERMGSGAVWGFVLMAGLVLWQASSPAVYVDLAYNDIFVPLEAGWMAAHGLVPHLDVYSPIGGLYFAVHGLAAALAGGDVRAVIWTDCIVAPIFAAMMVWIGRSRLPGLATGLLGFVVGIVALSPHDLGRPALWISHLSDYNRHAWCLAIIASIATGVVRRDGTRRVSDLAILITAMGGLLYLKLTAFLAIGGFVAAALILRRDLVGLVVVCACLAALAGMIELAFPGYHRAYFSDVSIAAAASGFGSVKQRLENAFWICLVDLIGVTSLAIVLMRGGAKISDCVLPVLLVIGGAAIASQNHEAIDLLEPCGYILLWAAAARVGLDGMAQRLVLSAAAGLAVLAWVGPVGWDVAGVVEQGIEARDVVATVGFVDDPGSPLALLRLPARVAGGGSNICVSASSDDSMPASEDDISPADYRAVEADGLRLLRDMDHPKVIALQFSNPFPLALGAPPARGDALWWHVGRTISERSTPDAERVLADADVVMEAKRGYHGNAIGATLRSAWAGALERKFELTAETPCWRLWRRRG